MKKFLTVLAIAGCLFVSAQVTTPRYGTTSSQDNTGRVLTYALITTTDVTSATLDTLTFTPNAWETIWRPSANLADSVVVKFSSTTTTYRLGDSFTIMLTKGTGNGRIRFGGSQYIISTVNSTGIPILANKTLLMRFRWNGSKWHECDKVTGL